MVLTRSIGTSEARWEEFDTLLELNKQTFLKSNHKPFECNANHYASYDFEKESSYVTL